jgi:hypothetical protein
MFNRIPKSIVAFTINIVNVDRYVRYAEQPNIIQVFLAGTILGNTSISYIEMSAPDLLAAHNGPAMSNACSIP